VSKIFCTLLWFFFFRSDHYFLLQRMAEKESQHVQMNDSFFSGEAFVVYSKMNSHILFFSFEKKIFTRCPTCALHHTSLEVSFPTSNFNVLKHSRGNADMDAVDLSTKMCLFCDDSLVMSMKERRNFRGRIFGFRVIKFMAWYQEHKNIHWKRIF
jgi:hypothetical protein